jgi:type VII secretion-associated serine protease mycosin
MCVVMAGGLAAVLPVGPALADQVRDAQWHLGFLHVAEAQKISQGDGVIVAVVDSGVDASHPDLAGNVLPGIDLLDSGKAQRDEDGHGTQLAGLIAAHGRGSAGVLGIAPKARILPVRAARNIQESHLSDGILWAVDHGAKVICIAIGEDDGVQLDHAVKRALASDVVVIAAAGNRPDDAKVAFPAALPGVVAVTGVDQSGNHASISVAGPEAVIAAPAVRMVSTYPGGRYFVDDGTSYSTAIVAGVAALVRAKYPNLSAAEVVHRLTATAIDKGAPGRDDEYGYGVVDLVAALTKDVPPLKASATPSATAAPAPSMGASQPAANGRGLLIALTIFGVAALIIVLTIGLVALIRRSA